jgi:hypothetical protein
MPWITFCQLFNIIFFLGRAPAFLLRLFSLQFRACLNFVFASENCPERVLAKRFLSLIAALWDEKSVKSGSFMDSLQRKG